MLAKLSTLHDYVDVSLPLSKCAIYKHIEDYTDLMWQVEWYSTNDCRQTKALITEITNNSELRKYLLAMKTKIK